MDGERTLTREIRGLRESFEAARAKLDDEEVDLAKLGTLVARLSDSLGRALLVQEKLLAGNERDVWLQAERDRLLREMGLGETELSGGGRE
jgi:hypothetical protein